MRMIERHLQAVVDNLVKWYETNSHSFSASKSCYVNFCLKRGVHPDPEIRIRDLKTPVVPEVRFLGVIFDRQLTCLPHILQLRKNVFTEETFAIHRVLKLIDSNLPRRYYIYTDSMSVLEALENYNNQCHPVVLMATTYRPLSVPLSDMKRVILHNILTTWQESWSQQLDNKFHSVEPIVGAWPVIPMRRNAVKSTRLRIGHTSYTPKHLLLGENAPECPSCKVSYTVRHILIDCTVFNHHRITFFH
ncbi:RNase H domain-containing protein [Trichonephila clavipes]|nr:RNase H domain-containing protein [Trichonephila clavipes]